MMSLTANNSRPFIILGSGGHAKVVISCSRGWTAKFWVFVIQDFQRMPVTYGMVPILGDDEKIENYSSDEIFLALAVGHVER